MRYYLLLFYILLSFSSFSQNNNDTIGTINISINGEETIVKKYSSQFETDLTNGKTYLGFIFQVISKNSDFHHIEIKIEIDSVVKFVKPDFKPINNFKPIHGLFNQDGTGFMFVTIESKLTISFLANIEGYLNFFSGHFEYVAIRKTTQDSMRVEGNFENLQYWYILDNQKHGFVVD